MHEKLEKLTGVLNDWPPDLGRETVCQAIELTLGEIQRVDDLADLPKTHVDDSPEKAAAAETSVDSIVKGREAWKRYVAARRVEMQTILTALIRRFLLRRHEIALAGASY